MKLLEAKTGLITGCGTGIGRATSIGASEPRRPTTRATAAPAGCAIKEIAARKANEGNTLEYRHHSGLKTFLLALALTAGIWLPPIRAEEVATRSIPSRTIPVPSSASLELQNFLRQPRGPAEALRAPKTPEDWKRLTEPSASSEESSAQALSELRQRVGVTVVPETIAGVRCYIVTPRVISPKNRRRLILNLHPGGFIWGRGERGTEWATRLASTLGYRVIVIDYRLLPEHPFPAALDDANAVWKSITRSSDPKSAAFVGGSVGGGMVLSMVQRAKLDGSPLPGAVVSVSPGAADLSKTGDTWYTNAGVDNLAYDDFWDTVFRFYANGRGLKDPAVSPLYGDFNGFPPTYLVSGTRDALLSDTVRAQQKLMQASVTTQLVVGESLPHVGPFMTDIPEVREIYSDIARFLDAQLRY